MPRNFTHKDPDHPPHRLATVLRWAIFDRLRGRRRVRPPGPGAPRVPYRAGVHQQAGTHVTWIGHASFLLTLDGAHVLIDPVLSRRLGTYRRHVPPGLAAGDLPAIDLLLITHAHYDHLDVPTVELLPRETPVILPLGLGAFFRRRGFRRVRELDWWEGVEAGSLTVTLAPARHWSRRTPWDLNRSLWGGFLIEGVGGTRVYHAGDSAAFAGFAEIGRRFPGLDLAMLPIGAYEPAWFMEHSHMNPEQAGEAFLALGALRFLPMHWGTFQLTDEPLAEPLERLEAWWEAHAPAGSLEALAVGESLSF